ncbi:polysaccharide deacetylase family protein [Corynebacterium faecium]|uniref:polysaccharide deacetylase family protein n=1 Tax=Corynebacterium faecium TaxID=3016001 RepID=UPI0022B33FCA|nr:polysaccharide deacetylase family protein [Corynebacterium faecium]
MKRLLTAVTSATLLAAATLAPSPASADVSKVTQLALPQDAKIISGDSFGPILVQGAGLPIDGSSAFIAGSSDRARSAVEDGWRRAYNGLPGQVKQAVPPHLRPPEPAKPADVTVAPAQEPAPSPVPPNCYNCVAITYDDGPVPGSTERLLDILKRKGVHATFFVVGRNANANPQILRRIRDEGHTIGNHSFSHPDLARQSDGAIAAQLDDTDAALQKQAGLDPHWLRPPYGSHNPRVASAAGARGMALAVWDVDTADWQHRNPATTCKRAVDGAREGSIILMHDIHQPTVDAAECVIDGLRAKGLNPVGLDEMIKRPEAGHVYTRAD